MIAHQISAPGKLFWIGEYAVLDGVPAIVAAVDRCAAVSVVSTVDTSLTFTSSLFEGERVLRTADGAFTSVRSEETALIQAVIETLTEHNVLRESGAQVEVDSSNLSGTSKYGLGSSGAVAAGLTGVLIGPGQAPDEIARLALDAHHRFQGRVGSGSDVLASLHGGVLRVQQGQGVTLSGGSGLKMAVIYTGESSSTPLMVRQVRSWRDSEPRIASKLFASLAAAAERGVGALEDGNSDEWLRAVSDYAWLEAELTRASDVPIINESVREAMDLAERYGYVAKPSGAGGGDIVVAFADLQKGAVRLEQKHVPLGSRLEVLALAVQPIGVLGQLT